VRIASAVDARSSSVEIFSAAYACSLGEAGAVAFSALEQAMQNKRRIEKMPFTASKFSAVAKN
jgi:hypothetical protein